LVKKWLNKGLSDFVISKVKPLLAGDKPEGYTFAIKILDQMKLLMTERIIKFIAKRDKTKRIRR